MSESPTKKRKNGQGPMNGGGGDPYSRYSQHYGQPPPQAYGSHPPPPPYGYHQPPPPHYPQNMYPPNQPPPPPNYQVSPMYPSPPPPQSWTSPPSQASIYCQPVSTQPPSNQHPRSRQPDNWKNEPNLKGSRNSEEDVSSSGGNRRYVNGPDRRQSQSSPSNKNGGKASSPSKGGGNGVAASSASASDGSRGGWNQNNWHGASAQGRYMRGPPPPNVWNSSGSPPNWNGRGPNSGPGSGEARRGSPSSSARQMSSSSMRKPKSDDGDKDKGRGSYRCGKCGVPKKGHICPYQPKFKRRPDEPLPEMRNASTQVEMDEFLVLRRLNLEIQGFPESYTSEPLGDVGAEPHPPLVANSPHGPHGPHPPPQMIRNTMMGVVPPGAMPPPPPHHQQPHNMGPMSDPNGGPILSNSANEMNGSFPPSSVSPPKGRKNENISDRGTSPMRR